MTNQPTKENHPMKISKMQANQLAYILDAEVRMDYEGRANLGSTCLGFLTDRSDFEIGFELGRMSEEPGQVFDGVDFGAFGNCHSDAMGMTSYSTRWQVVYFPSVSVT